LHLPKGIGLSSLFLLREISGSNSCSDSSNSSQPPAASKQPGGAAGERSISNQQQRRQPAAAVAPASLEDDNNNSDQQQIWPDASGSTPLSLFSRLPCLLLSCFQASNRRKQQSL
ncbi:hypothetical protein AABB24_030167, partial [Solanum stoloniferum]